MPVRVEVHHDVVLRLVRGPGGPEPDRAVATGLPWRQAPPALAESLLPPFRASPRPDAGAPPPPDRLEP